MGGWSQGASVVHKAAQIVDKGKDSKGASLMKSVAAVVTFGDPMGSGSSEYLDPHALLPQDDLSEPDNTYPSVLRVQY